MRATIFAKENTSASKLPAFSQVFKKSAWHSFTARLMQGKFYRNILLLSSGTAIGQAILVACIPLLTRLYSPEDFGTLALFVSCISILATISTLRYEVVIPLPEKKINAAEALVLSLICIVTSVGIICFAVTQIDKTTLRMLGGESLASYLWFIPLGVLCVSLHMVIGFWMVRHQNFKPLAYASVTQAITQSISQISMGIFGLGSLGLITGDLAGRSSYSAPLLWQCLKNSREVLSQVSLRGIKSTALRYWRFPLIASWAGLLNAAAIHLPLLLFAYFYSLEVVGWLALAQRILGTPTTLLSNSVAKVYFSEFARLRHKAPEQLAKLFRKTVISQAAFAGLLFFFVALPAPLLSGYIFGNQWQSVGWCVLILSLMFVCKLISYPLGATLDVLEKPGWHIIRELIRLTLILVAVIIAAGLKLDPLAAIGVLSIASSISYCLGIFIVWRLIQQFPTTVKTI